MRLGPSGWHFFQRATGLNILFDEVKAPKSSWASAPRQVSVALTNACELACPHCYAPKIPGALNFDDLVGWLDELDKNGCIGVGFGGGEPTLYRRFSELCEHTACQTSLAVTFTTHAHHLTDELVAALANNVRCDTFGPMCIGELHISGLRPSPWFSAHAWEPVGEYVVDHATIIRMVERTP